MTDREGHCNTSNISCILCNSDSSSLRRPSCTYQSQDGISCPAGVHLHAVIPQAILASKPCESKQRYHQFSRLNCNGLKIAESLPPTPTVSPTSYLARTSCIFTAASPRCSTKNHWRQSRYAPCQLNDKLVVLTVQPDELFPGTCCARCHVGLRPHVEAAEYSTTVRAAGGSKVQKTAKKM